MAFRDCKECGEFFFFGYSKKYCSEECYDEAHERKARKIAKQEELNRLKSSFQRKWGVSYDSGDTPREISRLERSLKNVRKKITELETLQQELSIKAT